MTEKLEIDFDKAWLNELERIRNRIGLYIGSNSLEALSIYSSGYFAALEEFASHVEGDFSFIWFGHYVKEKLGFRYENSFGPSRQIRTVTGDDDSKAIELYYELLDEYKIRKWGNYLGIAKLDDTNQAKPEWCVRYEWQDGKAQRDENGDRIKYVYPIPETIKLFYSTNLFSIALVTFDSENGAHSPSFHDSLEDALSWAEKILGVRRGQWEFESGSYPTWQRSKILDVIRSKDFGLFTQGIIALVNIEGDDQFVENFLLNEVEQHTDSEMLRIVLYGLMRRTSSSNRKWIEVDRANSILSKIPDSSSNVILRIKKDLLDSIEKQL